MALFRGFHDGSGIAHRKAEYTYATALPCRDQNKRVHRKEKTNAEETTTTAVMS